MRDIFILNMQGISLCLFFFLVAHFLCKSVHLKSLAPPQLIFNEFFPRDNNMTQLLPVMLEALVDGSWTLLHPGHFNHLCA